MKKFKITELLILLVCTLLLLWTPVDVEAAEKPGAVILSSSVSGNIMRLKWTRATGADGYYLYRYQESTGKYKRIKKLTSPQKTSLKLTGKKDRTYRFRVRAYSQKTGKMVYGPISKPHIIKTAPSEVEVYYAKCDSPRIATLKWKKVESADGYQVFKYDDSKGKYVLAKTLVGAASTGYKETGLASKFLCKYKIRAYRKNAAQTIYGKFTKEIEVKYRSVLFIGDSRTVMMKSAVKTSIAKWICKTGEGYNWLSKTAMPNIEANLYNVNNVVIWLGVNDVHNINNYIKIINRKAAEWSKKGIKTYVCAVGQVEKDPYVTNKEILQFNRKLIKGLKGTKYINIYKYLKQNGYDTIDGTHYTSKVSKQIYKYIVNTIY